MKEDGILWTVPSDMAMGRLALGESRRLLGVFRGSESSLLCRLCVFLCLSLPPCCSEAIHLTFCILVMFVPVCARSESLGFPKHKDLIFVFDILILHCRLPPPLN